jgi:pimeloyl-ACP methyl ester carboxylesterase
MASLSNDNASVKDLKQGSEPAASTSRFVDAGGLRLHYLDYGTGHETHHETQHETESRPAILCVHGGAAHAHWFDYVAPFLSPRYHVRALDQRGHGNSDWVDPPAYSYQDYASDLAQVAEKLDLRDFVLIGHSMGGMVSLVYAATYPGRVGKLVIVDTSMKLSEDRIAAMRDRGSRPGSSYATREELITRYRMLPAGTLARPDVIRHMGARSARQFPDGTWRHRFDRNVYAIRESVDGMQYWEQIKIPALVIKGDRSPRITPEIYAGVKARCPQAELAEVPMSDHHVTLDNPSGFAQALQAFLDK